MASAKLVLPWLFEPQMRISVIVNSCFGIVNTRFGHRERSEATPGVQASS